MAAYLLLQQAGAVKGSTNSALRPQHVERFRLWKLGLVWHHGPSFRARCCHAGASPRHTATVDPLSVERRRTDRDTQTTVLIERKSQSVLSVFQSCFREPPSMYWRISQAGCAAKGHRRDLVKPLAVRAMPRRF